jgi:hypothetical protein
MLISHGVLVSELITTIKSNTNPDKIRDILQYARLCRAAQSTKTTDCAITPAVNIKHTYLEVM